jgi:hypothetical protein
VERFAAHSPRGPLGPPFFCDRRSAGSTTGGAQGVGSTIAERFAGRAIGKTCEASFVAVLLAAHSL